MNELARIVEALLFLSPDPLSLDAIVAATNEDLEDVREALAELEDAYAPGARGLILKEVAGGVTLATDPVAEPAARRLLAAPRTPPLTPAQAETLSIVAYLQPISRPEIGRIRGVSPDSATATLVDRGLIEETGRSPFGAALYRTTPLFLKLFGLSSLDALPDVAEWDPSPEDAAEIRERLGRAGDARAGLIAAAAGDGSAGVAAGIDEPGADGPITVSVGADADQH